METTNENTKIYPDPKSPLIPHDDPRRDAVNNFVFENYAHKWALKRNFFPVFLAHHKYKLLVRLYIDSSSRDKRQVEEYVLDFYRTIFTDFWFDWADVEFYPYKIKPSKYKISKCTSLYDLENLYTKDPNNCAWTGRAGTISSRIPRQFYYWDNLIEEGYLTDKYERKCRQEMRSGVFYVDSKPKRYYAHKSFSVEEDENGIYSVKPYEWYEGNQPEIMNAISINRYFYIEFSKQFLIKYGVIAIFNYYSANDVNFNLFSDPRSNEIRSRYSNRNYGFAHEMAAAFSRNIRVLSGTVSFTVKHFKTSDTLVVRESKSGYPLEILSQDAGGKLTKINIKAQPFATHHGRRAGGRWGYW